MKKQALYLIIAIGAFFASCSSKTEDPGITPTNSNVVEVTGDISTATTWKADKIYLLKGFVYVTSNATLTIEPGTIIKGDKVTKGSLVITRGAKISAIGTVDKPIVFTSNQPAGSRNTGDWGGLIILGKAPVNQPGGEVVIEGGLTPTNGGSAALYTTYGGTIAADNSGTLKYVRLEYGGVPFAPDNEINGLTLGGVGSGTTIDYVEVYRAGDDSIEWFGGTVNAKHLLSIGALDDDFDTDFGFSGSVQYALAQRYPTVADVSGSNGFESDNDGAGSNFAPTTSAVFSNTTIIGPRWASTVNANYQHAAQIRRSSSLSIYNSVFADYDDGLFIDDTRIATGGVNTSERYLGETSTATLFLKNNIVYNCNRNNNQLKAATATRTGVNTASILSLFTTKFTVDGNVLSTTLKGADLMVDPNKLSSDFASAGIPNWLLKSGSVALTGASFTDAKVAGTFFDKVTFRGAFGTENWAAGWAHFDPQTLPYTTPGAVK
jgi:hypothetical protein